MKSFDSNLKLSVNWYLAHRVSKMAVDEDQRHLRQEHETMNSKEHNFDKSRKELQVIKDDFIRKMNEYLENNLLLNKLYKNEWIKIPIPKEFKIYIIGL